jgi:glycosyltransferase involved in cell wall biosynthesis
VDVAQVRDDLDTWERTLLDGTASDEAADRYHAAAVALGRQGRALQFFDALRKQRPDDFQIAGRYISMCLQQGEDGAAMIAIEALAGRAAPPEGILDAGLAVRRRLGPIRPDPASDETLSLCMIARNEGSFLGPCLLGVKPLVDEIILIDTGSTDRTSDIGLLFGAQVHAFTWCADFSAARNFAIAKATGRWVLILDADEAIAPQDFDALRGLIRRCMGGRTALAVETRNYSHRVNAVGWRANDGRYTAHEAGLGWFPSTKVRLFQRDPQIRFHFPVHERVEPSLTASGIRVVPCPVPVHHYGHLNETRNQEKARVYYELGYAKLDELRDDPAAIRELAVQAGQLERWPEATALWERLLVLRPDYPEALVNMASVHWQLGHYTRSLEWARRAVAKDALLKEGQFNLALSHLLLGDFARAATLLEQLLRMHPDYLAAGFMLAVTYACLAWADKAAAMMQRLAKTQAASALPAAIEDIHRRLRSAGHEPAGQQVLLAFHSFLK